jgi:hypothetical protein
MSFLRTKIEYEKKIISKKQKSSSEIFNRFLKELKMKNRSQIMFCVKVSQLNDTKT